MCCQRVSTQPLEHTKKTSFELDSIAPDQILNCELLDHEQKPNVHLQSVCKILKFAHVREL